MTDITSLLQTATRLLSSPSFSDEQINKVDKAKFIARIVEANTVMGLNTSPVLYQGICEYSSCYSYRDLLVVVGWVVDWGEATTLPVPVLRRLIETVRSQRLLLPVDDYRIRKLQDISSIYCVEDELTEEE